MDMPGNPSSMSWTRILIDSSLLYSRLIMSQVMDWMSPMEDATAAVMSSSAAVVVSGSHDLVDSRM